MVNNSLNSFDIIKLSANEWFPDSKILLFGSRARQNHSPESDYDFLIITKNQMEEHQKRYYRSLLRKELAKYKIPADIIINSEDEVAIKKEITGHIIREILREGILI